MQREESERDVPFEIEVNNFKNNHLKLTDCRVEKLLAQKWEHESYFTNLDKEFCWILILHAYFVRMIAFTA